MDPIRQMRGQKDLRSKWKCGSVGSKIKEKIVIKWKKKLRQTLGASVSGTKCDRDKLFFSAERVGQSDRYEA